jgi:two-component system, chemotaxis family, CheB/CheR fusion protein
MASPSERHDATDKELHNVIEELECSREEIQSANEQLAAENQELRDRNEELSQANAELNSLLASVDVPIVVLDWDLRIRRFTPAAAKALNLIPGDVGRPLTDIRLNVDVPDIDYVLAAALRSTTGFQCDVQDQKGRWFSLRVRQFRTARNRVDGAVLMLMDIDSAKQAERVG